MTVFEGSVEVPGGRLWAQWAGDGSGVVLVHAGIADARMWDPQWVDGPGQPVGRAPEAVRAFVRLMDLETLVQDKVTGRPVPMAPPAAGRLGEVAVPVLAIVGLLDGSGTAQAADALVAGVAGVAGARRVDVPGVAHLPNLEHPEWFTKTLLTFLAEIG